MRTSQFNLIDLLDNHFVGHSEITRLDELVRCARETSGFVGSMTEFVRSLERLEEFEVVEVSEPLSGESVHYVWDKRQVDEGRG